MNQYILATIQLPLLIKPDGSYEPVADHAIVHFENCSELPPKQEQYQDMAAAFYSLLQDKASDEPVHDHEETESDASTESDQEATPLTILATEIKRAHRKPVLNTTFRNRTKEARRYSAKNR